MTSISGNNNFLASLFNEKAKRIINELCESKRQSAVGDFMLPEDDSQGNGSVQSQTPTINRLKSLSAICPAFPTWGSASQTPIIDGRPLTESERRMVDHRCAKAPIVVCITGPGEYGRRTEEERGKLDKIVDQYFRQVCEEFGCSTSDFMPYNYYMPEYDPAIEKQMGAALSKLVTEDPECERLIKKINGIFPPLPLGTINPLTMSYNSDWGARFMSLRV